jgi:hypothetical protein
LREQVQQRIDEAVFQAFSQNRFVRFPYDPLDALALFPSCRHMTYDELAGATGKTHDEIISACGSYDGTTRFDKATRRFLILINDSDRNILSKERIRWTTAHEIGHIVCGHFEDLAAADAEEVQSSEITNWEMEEEADCFAATLLAPLPVLCSIGVKDVRDIRIGFGLSQAAAERRWAEFQRYLKTSDVSIYTKAPYLWRLFREKRILSPIPHHFFRSPKLPKFKGVDVPFPDTDL